MDNKDLQKTIEDYLNLSKNIDLNELQAKMYKKMLEIQEQEQDQPQAKYKYKIICDMNLEYFEEKICAKLNEGWIIKGNVFIKDNMFCQPMIKKE
jgi:hypothetical protein